MKLKKSLLSLATVLALSNTLSADSTTRYLPLTSKSSDSSWILFGVNGYSNGIPSAGTTSSAFSSGYTSFKDDAPNDEAADSTNALQDSGSHGIIATLQGIKDTGLTGLLAAIDISTAPAPIYDGTESVRTMYFKKDDKYVKLDYKASLEGKKIELYINDTMYNSTISQSATYDSPASLKDGNIGSSDANKDDMKKVTAVLDYNFVNNPYDPSSFDKSTQLDTTGQTATFYHFNAKTQQWEIWNKNSTVNDFESFDLGKAYWGRIDKSDKLGSLTNDGTTNRAGLILGDDSAGTVPDESRYVDANESRLVEGWNMLSFDDVQPYIRHSATALHLGGVTNGNEQFTITDASGLNSFTTAVFADGSETDIVAANKKLESLKLRGLLPQSFNVKFFRGADDGEVIIISDEKFSITQAAGTAVTDVLTVTDANPYVAGVRTAVTDLTAVTATSAYGEYMVFAQVNVEDFDTTASNVADTLGASTGGVAKIAYKEDGKDEETVAISVAGTTTYDQFTTQMGTLTKPTANPTITQVDVDFSGDDAGDLVLIADTEHFSLKDKTYTRVFDYTAPVGAQTIHAVLGTTTDIALSNGDDVSTAAGDVDGVTDLSSDDVGGKLLVVNNTTSSFDIKDVESGTVDLLKSAKSTDIAAEGAISDVYRVDTIARKAVEQVTSVVATITTSANHNESFCDEDNTDSIDYTVNGGTKQNVTIAAGAGGAAGADTYGELKTMLDDLVTSMNAYMETNNLHAYASHDYTIPAGKSSAQTLDVVGGAATAHTVHITLKGVDVASLVIGFTDDDGTAGDVGTAAGESTSGNGGQIKFGDGDLRADLKINPVFAPNYATYGPLYTMRKAGFDVKAMLKATTAFDDQSGDITWDSIDITRGEKNWFKNNEYNLFNINNTSGYWVYLTPKDTTQVVTISDANVTDPAYTYYFSNNTGATPNYPTTNLLTEGQLTVTITGLDEAAASSAYASIKGEKIQLTKSGNTYTGSIGTYALKELTQNTTGPTDVLIRAVNGKGQAVEASTKFDYQPPSGLSVTASSGTNLAFSADNNATKFYMFKDYIPELKAKRNALTTTVEVNATNSTATYNACKEYDFDNVSTLRVVAADGDIDSANLSAAVQIKYASLLKSANVLTHVYVQGIASKSQLGKTYTATCDLNTTQTDVNNNAGVSLRTLAVGKTYRISFQPIEGANISQDVAWTSQYEITNTHGAVIEIQNTPQYAGKTFYVEIVGSDTIYKATFPADKDAADASINGDSGAPIDFESYDGITKTLLP